MSVVEALRAAVREIGANRFRSFLSFLAIAVGTASLLYTLAQTRGMQRALKRNVELMGPGAMLIGPKRNYLSNGRSTGLTADDAAAIREALPELYMVYPRVDVGGLRFAYEGQTLDNVEVKGVTPEWARRNWVYSLRGRFLNERDEAEAARVCVVFEPAGWRRKPWWAPFADDLDTPFGKFVARHDLLGQRILLNDRVFTVVGVLKPPPRDLDPRWDWWDTPEMLAPISAVQQALRGTHDGIAGRVDDIHVDTGDEGTIASSRARIKALLLRRHDGEEDFEFTDMREAIESKMSSQRKEVKAALLLGLVAMLAGGIGIMNVMLAAVFSRVKEIGIRRAVGASRLDILAQFLAEAGLLGLAGGLTGLAMGAGALAWLAAHTNKKLAEMTLAQAVSLTLLAAAVSALFAAVPAWRASRLDPVEALRSEG